MGRTRIELLSSGDIDMYDDVSTPLNYAISDIRTPEKRDASYSKTIKVPGTKGNNIRFGHIFDVNIGDGTFNPNVKAPCTIYIDDLPQMSGYLQVLSIEIDDEKRIEYNVCIKGQVGSIFTAIGERELTDLDFSEFNHTYDKTNQKGTWNNPYTDGYIYPLIEYGFDNDLNRFNVEQLYPAIFVRQYIDKIFADAGYIYESNFFNSDPFTKLIIPSNSNKLVLNDTEIQARLYDCTQASSGTISLGAYPSGAFSTTQTVNIDTVINDPASQVSIAADTITIYKSGYYNLNFSVNHNFSVGNAPLFNMRIERASGLPTYVGGYGPVAVPSIATTLTACAGANVFLNAGDVLTAKVIPYNPNGSATQYNFSGFRLWNEVVNSGIIEGDNVLMNNSVPLKIKQKDFLLSLIKMFNLYVEVDKDVPNKLYIETRDDFYSSGTTVNWHYKLDNSKPLEITPMGDLDFRDFYYSYTDDSDKYNKDYKDKYQLAYGNRLYQTGNEFLTGKNEVKVIFSPTPLVADPAQDRVIPRIYNLDESGAVKPKAFNIRLLYCAGEISTSQPWTFEGRTSGISTETTYCYAGHLDNPNSPTFDLSFAVPYELYYTATSYTNNNVFNKYHKKFIDEITDKDSKIVTGYFYLTPKDIKQLDFRNQFFFGEQLYRLNKIFDYNPIDQQTTKCEFIKIKESNRFTSKIQTIYGGHGTLIGAEAAPFLPSGSLPMGNTTTKDDVIVTGTRNNIGSNVKSAIINGDYNSVFADNVTLLNSSGCTIDGTGHGVTAINSSGTTFSIQDGFYLYGSYFPRVGLPFAKVRNVSSSNKTVNLNATDGVVFVTTSSSRTTVNLPIAGSYGVFESAVSVGKSITIKKVDSAVGDVLIVPATGGLIEDATSYTLTTQYQSITVQSNGTNWYIIGKV